MENLAVDVLSRLNGRFSLGSGKGKFSEKTILYHPDGHSSKAIPVVECSGKFKFVLKNTKFLKSEDRALLYISIIEVYEIWKS